MKNYSQMVSAKGLTPEEVNFIVIVAKFPWPNHHRVKEVVAKLDGFPLKVARFLLGATISEPDVIELGTYLQRWVSKGK